MTDTQQYWVSLATLIDGLENGMAASVSGRFGEDGELFADRIVVLKGPRTSSGSRATHAVTTSYIVLPVKFPTNAAAPFTYARIRSRSLRSRRPCSRRCRRRASLRTTGRRRTAAVAVGRSSPTTAAADGFSRTRDTRHVRHQRDRHRRRERPRPRAATTSTSYTGRVYVFTNNVPGCGWSGLAYVGWERSYIKQTTSLLVISHELGHNFGLLHAASLDCGANVIGGTCTSSEYGDPFGIMGNQRAMHFNAAQKAELGLDRPAAPSGRTRGRNRDLYADADRDCRRQRRTRSRFPPAANRTYWLEYRQPIGFDCGTVVVIRTTARRCASRRRSSRSAPAARTTREFLDMTPATGRVHGRDAGRGAELYVDATYGITVTAVSQGAGGLTVTVASPTRPTFGDVPATHPNYLEIETLYWYGITKGCSGAPMLYCPVNTVSRAELAVFIERAKRGAAFVGTATGSPFADVPAGYWAGGQIEQLYADGITAGCSSAPRLFCPDGRVTRAEMAVFLMRSRYGGTFNPGTATGTVFADVPASYWAAAWIERANQYGVMTRCATGPVRFCPDQYVTRAEMAPLLRSTFSLTPAPL